MKNYIELLTGKWGTFVSQGHSLSNGNMIYISDDARLNVLFEPLELSDILDYFQNVLEAKLHPELQDIYKWSNGVRLFFASLNIYGIKQNRSKDVFEPFDLYYENNKIKGKDGIRDYLVFGSIGGQYSFAYNKTNPTKVFGFKAGETEILQEFDGVYDFFDHYFIALYDEYDINCKKIHPTEKYKGIPVLENKYIELL